MKYLKLFEDHPKLYTQIGYNEYKESCKSLQDFSKKYANRISEIFNGYKHTDFIEDYHNTKCINVVIDKSGKVLNYDDLNDGDYDNSEIFDMVILKYRKKGIIDNTYVFFDVAMSITQNEDGWFYVKYSYYIPDRTTPITFYKCDQIDGLLNFICDIIERGTNLNIRMPGMPHGAEGYYYN